MSKECRSDWKRNRIKYDKITVYKPGSDQITHLVPDPDPNPRHGLSSCKIFLHSDGLKVDEIINSNR